jgi:hypothetical protein
VGRKYLNKKLAGDGIMVADEGDTLLCITEHPGNKDEITLFEEDYMFMIIDYKVGGRSNPNQRFYYYNSRMVLIEKKFKVLQTGRFAITMGED